MNDDNHSDYLAFNEDELRVIFAQLGEWKLLIDAASRKKEVAEVEAIRTRINDHLSSDKE